VTAFAFRCPDAIRATTDGDQFAALPACSAPYLLNGDFATTDYWVSADATWVVGSGVATATSCSAALTQTTVDRSNNLSRAIVAGRKYLLTYTVGGTPAGTLTPSLGGTAGTGVTTTGIKQEVIVAGSSNANLVFTGTGFTGTIDNVSLIPLTPPLSARAWDPMSVQSVAAVVQGTATIVTTSPAWIGWYDSKGSA
jgi:hypothetical protein